MSSIYRVLCLAHNPAITAADGDWYSPELAEQAIQQGIDDHADCDLLIGRYSYPLIEVGCPGIRVRRDGTPGCKWHGPTEWIDIDWLRLLWQARHAPIVGERSPLIAASHANAMRCWKPTRLDSLAAELGVGPASEVSV